MAEDNVMGLKFKLGLLFGALGLSTAAAGVPAVDVGEFTRAVEVCVQATTKLGVDDKPFLSGGWTTEAASGAPGDRFYSKHDLRASLGTRPSGGSCIISFNIRQPYDLTVLTLALEQATGVKAVASGSRFSLIPIGKNQLIGRVDPIPTGSLVSVAVEMGE